MVIQWESGHLVIDLDRFFPCERDELIRLLQAVDLDHEHRDAHLNGIMSFLRRKELSERLKGNTDDAQILHLCQEEMKSIYGGSWE